MNVVIFNAREASLVCKKCGNFCRQISDISFNLFLSLYLVTFVGLVTKSYFICSLTLFLLLNSFNR